MDEAKNEYNIQFGPYSVELKSSQVYFRKNNSLVKAMPVKSTFGLYDLKKLVKKVAASVNMTSKLPKDVLKAGKEKERDLLKGDKDKIDMDKVFMKGRKKKRTTDEGKLNESFNIRKFNIHKYKTPAQQKKIWDLYKETLKYGSKVKINAGVQRLEILLWNLGELGPFFKTSDMSKVLGYAIDSLKDWDRSLVRGDEDESFIKKTTNMLDLLNKLCKQTLSKPLVKKPASLLTPTEGINENITLKGKDAGSWIENWGRGGRLNIDNMIYRSLGKGKWKGPTGKTLSWKEVAAMATELGDERVFFEGKLNEGYYVWSGTYGKDDPKKMKSLTYTKNLKSSIEVSKKLKAKYGNSRALLDREFEKDFPKAYKNFMAAKAHFYRGIFAGKVNEDFVRSGHMYKSLTYKVTDSKAVMAAYKKFKAGNRTINMVVKASGDTITISGHPTKGLWISPGIADQLDVAIQKTGKATLVKSDSKKLKENKMNKSEIKFRKMIREIAEPILKASMNEISAGSGLDDVIKGRTSSIEGIKMSKELAAAISTWIRMSPFGRKYGHQIMKGRIHSLIGPANSMGIERFLGGKTKPEWKALYKKHGPKREDVVEQLKSLKEDDGDKVTGYDMTEGHKSDSQMLKLAMKGAKAARVGSHAIKAYMDSLKNSWRLNPRDKKDYMDFTVDDWEEDVLYYIQNKG